MSTTTTLRNTDLETLAKTLTEQSLARYDIVAHSSNLRFEGGNLMVADQTQAIITEDGVTLAETCLTPTTGFDAGVGQRLGVPNNYLSRCKATPDARLYDANLNEWLAASDQKWFIRGFRSEGEACGIARAFLSSRFGCIDNLDILVAALSGVRAAGQEAHVLSADLSERRMQVKIAVPAIEAMAPLLLADYRSPFDNADPARAAALEAHGWLRPDDRPVVFAGFTIRNSETGHGAFTITPELIVKACTNGLTIKADALRKVHLGSDMNEGVIEWSAETNKKAIDLVTSQATDAVRQFCNPEYVERKLADITAEAGFAIDKPTEVIEKVCKGFSFSKEETEGVLGHFIKCGQVTTGGVMQAITSFSQTIADPDRAADVNDVAIDAMIEARKLVTA